MISELIKNAAESGLTETLYFRINDAGLIIALLYSLWHGTKLGIRLWKMLVIMAGVYYGIGYLGNLVWQGVQYVQEINFLGIETATNSIVRLFVLFPLLALPLALILRVKWSTACDAIAMYPLLRSCIGQLACIFTGCCRGLEWAGGIYNVRTESYHFPTPIFETAITAVIVVYLVIRTKKKQFTPDGTLYPLMMILYGIMRFYCELLRENEKIMWGCSAMAFHAVFMCIVGAAWLIICTRKKEADYEHPIQTDESQEGAEVAQGDQI